MKTELLDCFADEIVTTLNHYRTRQLTDSQAHLALVETFSSFCSLDALRILVRAVDKADDESLTQHLGRLMFDTEGVNGNEESMAAHRASNFARNWSKHLGRCESEDSGKCDGVAKILIEAAEAGEGDMDLLGAVGFLIADNEHARGLLRRHLEYSLESNSISTIC